MATGCSPRAAELPAEEAEALREREAAMSFLTGEDADTDGSGEVEVDEAEVAAAREAETVADLMDSEANREIEAEVEEQVFEGLTEDQAAKSPERTEDREPVAAGEGKKSATKVKAAKK